MLSDLEATAFSHLEESWVPSTVTEQDLEQMVADQVLPEKTIIRWCPAVGETFPTLNTDEIIVFEYFFYRGFMLPTYNFFHGLLNYYRIELIHLKPNSILQITTFINLYEAYLCIRPHFKLFRYFFALKPSSKKGEPGVVGDTGLQLRQGRGKDHLGLNLWTSLKGWNHWWFYTSNLSPALHPFVRRSLVARDSWNSLSSAREMVQVSALLKKMQTCKDEGIRGISVIANFLGR